MIYVNDLANISNSSKFILFADDTYIIYNNGNLNKLINTVNDDLVEVVKWFNDNKLSINAKKKCILFSKTINNIPPKENYIN